MWITTIGSGFKIQYTDFIFKFIQSLMKTEPRLIQASIFLQNLSQTVALWLALLTGLGVMAIQYATWLNGSGEGYSLFALSFDQGSQFNSHLTVSLLLSVLSGLLVYQALMNRIRTQQLKNKAKYLTTLFQKLPGTTYRFIMDANDLRIEGVSSDIYQQRIAEDSARLQTEKLAHVARLNALGEMASGIAHEINQPLAAISLFAQAGKRLLACGQYERVPEVFDKLSQHAQRAGVIIERIQSMAKPHNRVKKLVGCYDLITEVAQLAQAEARFYDIKIELIIARKLPMVKIDILQIQQVILNLLRNGMQAMSAINCRNGNEIFLKAKMNNRNELEIGVVDSGDGISEQAGNSLFKAFSTTKETGIGMGLVISRAIIEAHNGLIKFFNNKNGGATFYFTLPTTKRDS